MEASPAASSVIPAAGYAPGQERWYCEQLEQGQVVLFSSVPFDFPESDRQFLLSQKQTRSRFHKNISYRPHSGEIKGVSANSEDYARLHHIMQSFSQETARFIAKFLSPYAGQVKLDYASFRPLEEQGRDLSLRRRNDLLHVDAFPSRPTRGARILRLFVNINPSSPRVWNVGQPFHALAPPILKTQKLAPPHRSDAARALTRVAARFGLPIPDRSRYDEFMLYFHDWLKENADFQKNSPKREVIFPPGACWLVYTDGVPHAAMSGQFALEQTFIVPVTALVSPEAAPIRVLESATATRMAG